MLGKPDSRYGLGLGNLASARSLIQNIIPIPILTPNHNRNPDANQQLLTTLDYSTRYAVKMLEVRDLHQANAGLEQVTQMPY